MLNKFRKKCYDDDGCTIYECLSCHDTWNVRHVPTTYCPSCGIKFEGELVWDEEKKYNRPMVHYRSDNNLKDRYWVIVERSISEYESGPSDWEWTSGRIEIRLPGDSHDYRDASLRHDVQSGREGVAKAIQFLKNAVEKTKDINEKRFGQTEYAAALLDSIIYNGPFKDRLLIIKPICVIKDIW